MHDCTHYQTLLLEHLYGLLEGDESRALLDHLGGCAPCQAALDRARQQQHLLATAAKQEFPAVRFEAPAAEASPAVLPLPEPAAAPRPARRWVRWAAAAALLLTVGGLAVPAASFTRDYLQARDAARAHDDEVATARHKANFMARRITDLPVDQSRKVDNVWRTARKRQFNLIVSGPQRVQVGAPSDYRIHTRNLDGVPVPARLDVRVVDQTGQAVLEEKDVKSGGEYQLTLQPNLPLRPDTALALEVNARREGDADADSSLREHLELLPPTYVTHLATDRPMYQLGDTVRFRSLTLERFSLKPPPPADDFHLVYSITDSKGVKTDILSGAARLRAGAANGPDLRGPDGQLLRGVGAGEFFLDGEFGGEYTLTVREANNRFPPQERKFLVNRYQPSLLNKDFNFDRSSYGAGEMVVARLKVTRPNGEPAAGCQATPHIRIDGTTFGQDGIANGKVSPVTADDGGKVDVTFKLPGSIVRGEASLGVTLKDRTGSDGIVRTIPIVLKTLQVDFYPEGGDLVAGTDNRVYFQVRTTLDKPGDLHGQVVDDRGNVVVDDVHTLTDADAPGVNQGMGVFMLHPDSTRKYELKIDAPLGVSGKHALPEPRGDGDALALKVVDGVTGPADPIRVRVCSPRADKALLVGAYCRGRLLDHALVTAKQGEWAEVALNPKYGAGGVYRITAFEEMPGEGQAADRRPLKPRAERLVYRQPKEVLKLDVRPDQKQYIPGERVKLTVTASDEQGRPTGAVVLLGAVDKRTLTTADEKTARALPTHFLLTTEVRKPEDLEYADFLLSADPKAPAALDLLLGTQGWRRFAEQNPEQFKQKFRNDQKLRDDAERLLVALGQSSPKVIDFAREEVKRVQEEFAHHTRELEDEHAAALAAVTTLGEDATAAAARARLARYDHWFDRRRALAPVAALLLFLLLVTALFLILPRRMARSAPFGLAIGAGGVMVFFLSLLLVRPQHGRDAETVVVLGDAQEGMMMPPAAGDKGAAPRAEMNEARDQPPPMMPAAPPMGPGGGGIAGDDKMMKGQAAMAQPADAAKGEAKGKADDLMENADVLARVADKDRGANAVLADGAARRRAEREQAPLRGREAMRAQGLGLRDLEQAKRPALGGLAGGGFGGGAAFAPPPLERLVVREYAHANPSAGPAGGEVRSDFAETLLWQPALVIPVDGRATVSFQLCDSVTNFEVSAAGHTLDGRLGTTTAAVVSRLPFALDPRTPIEVSSADRIDVPVTVSNNTAEARAVSLSAAATGLDLVGDKADDRLTVAANSAVRRLYHFRPNTVEGRARVEFRGRTEPFAADGVARTFRIVPDGFPVVVARSDLLENTAVHVVELPETWVKGTLKCRAQVYPSTLASLQKGLEAMLREPNGCFEQTSTCNYPNVLILDYLKASDQSRPDLEARARKLMSDGYQKLTSFECPKTATNPHKPEAPAKDSKQGYEWFGAPDAAHEALTAYGLLQFRDMARVYPVDGPMLERTRQYLLASRDGHGGFRRNLRGLDTFGGAPDNITNAYIVWALTEGGPDDDVTKELDALNTQAKTSKDPYFVSLVAIGLLNRGRSDQALPLLKAVAGLQKEDGHLDAAGTSITRSGGRDLQIETTALAVLGWLKANRPADFTVAIEKSVQWIGRQRGGYGGFGSTQSTILALKALIAHARANKKTPEAGELTLSAGDTAVGRLPFPAGAQDVLTVEMPEAEKYLKPGKNLVRVGITGKNVFPYTLTWSYQTLKPVSAEGCAVRLATRLDREAAAEGESVRLTVTLQNATDQGQGMAVAIIGLPAGLEVPKDLKQLKEHALPRENGTKPGLISKFETGPREVILYWRDLAPRQKIEVPIDLLCGVPGEYRGPASRAYLYYNADAKHWVEPLGMKVAVKE